MTACPRSACPRSAGSSTPTPAPSASADSPDRDLLLGAELANSDLLTAIRALAWVTVTGERRIQPVDYRNLGAEELGSVYESLLELVPRLDLDAADLRAWSTWRATSARPPAPTTPHPRSSRRCSTPPWTPSSTTPSKNAKDPADAEARLLAVTVCDPACGSGGFLVAAARRIARRLAQVRSGEDEPTPEQVQHALRDVVGRCIYGVDLNDLAAELAKVSPVAGGPRTRQAPRLPRRPHPGRQLPARHHPGPAG